MPDAYPYAGLDAEAADALRSYLPDLADPRHAGLIRGLAASARPEGRLMALRFAAVLSEFVHSVDRVGQSLDADDLMRAGVIADYAARGMAGAVQPWGDRRAATWCTGQSTEQRRRTQTTSAACALGAGQGLAGRGVLGCSRR